jgi:hypothetical protein
METEMRVSRLYCGVCVGRMGGQWRWQTISCSRSSAGWRSMSMAEEIVFVVVGDHVGCLSNDDIVTTVTFGLGGFVWL